MLTAPYWLWDDPLNAWLVMRTLFTCLRHSARVVRDLHNVTPVSSCPFLLPISKKVRGFNLFHEWKVISIYVFVVWFASVFMILNWQQGQGCRIMPVGLPLDPLPAPFLISTFVKQLLSTIICVFQNSLFRNIILTE